MSEEETFRKLKKVPFEVVHQSITDHGDRTPEELQAIIAEHGWTTKEFISELFKLLSLK